MLVFLAILALDTAAGIYLGGPLGPKAAIALSRIAYSQIIGKFFEIRADLTAASLGEDVAQAGIDAFEEFQAAENRALGQLEPEEQGKAIVRQILFDPHPFSSFRAKYIGWYKNWKYQES